MFTPKWVALRWRGDLFGAGIISKLAQRVDFVAMTSWNLDFVGVASFGEVFVGQIQICIRVMEGSK